MSKRPRPKRLYLAGWIVKIIFIPAIILLATAFQVRPVAAPPSVPEAAALEAPVPDLAAPLVSFAVYTPTDQPEPTPTLPAPTPISNTAQDQVTVITIPFTPDVPDPQPKAIRLRATPTAAITPVTATVTETQVSTVKPITADVPILMYHYISDPPPGSDSLRYSLSVTPASLEAQMSYLQQAGFHAIALEDLYNYLTQGTPLPDQPIILTFDDGYEDAFTFAMPILQKHGFVGTFFVLTGPADRDGEEGCYLTWKQIAAMSAAGMDMELHGREHVDLRNRPNDFLVHQIAGGRDSIEAHTGRPVRWFAYPSGHYDAAVVRVLKSAGFVGSVTTAYGRTHTASGFFDLQRVRISGSDTLEIFKKVIAGSP
jgi:peptidoglycan/xylan/chitin deacetylase (PgdA/CDA1 family)